MLCALLGLLHAYSKFGSTFRVWGTPGRPVGVSVESNLRRMTIVHNESFRSCFTGPNPIWLSTTMARYGSPEADRYVLYPNPAKKSDVPSRRPTRASLKAITKRIEILRRRSDRIRSRMANVTNRLHGSSPRKLLALLRNLHVLIREKDETTRKITQATLQRFAPKSAHL